MATMSIEPEPDEPTQAAAWRLLEASDTMGISHGESVGFRMLLKRAHELAGLQSPHGQALRNVEDLAQLLALRKSGIYSRSAKRSISTLDSRPASGYARPAMAATLDRTRGLVLYADWLLC
jgi:hypothetical protein